MPKDKDTTQPGAPSVLHAPWRDVYMQELSASMRDVSDDPPGTFFEEYWAHPERDEANRVIARLGEGDSAGLILLNKYPYANGHLLIALAEPRPSLLEYAPAQRASLWEMVDMASILVIRTLEPQGLNIGINQGTAAGAGVPGHLHAHVVPRWNGDVNFISVVGQIRVIPSALDSMWKRYRDTWDSLDLG